MENKNPIFSIKNFRSFGKEGADFELAPITVLTGCNSAGKSSLVKAILLLANQEDGNTALGITNPRIGFAIRKYSMHYPSITLPFKPKLTLGRFDRVLNSKATTRQIEFSYTIWSKCLQERVVVRRVFTGRVGDMMDFGGLSSYSIEKLDGTIICRCTVQDYLVVDFEDPNYAAIKNNYSLFRSECDNGVYQKHLKKARENKSVLLGLSEEDLPRRVYDLVWNDENLIDKSADKYGKNIVIDWNSGMERIIEYSQENRNKGIDEKEIDTDGMLMEYYLILVNNEVVRPNFIKRVSYFDSTSAYVKRIYSLEDDSKLSKSLRWLNEKHVEHDKFSHLGCASSPDRTVGYFVNRWIKKFDIGEKIIMESSYEGLGVMVYRIKDGEKRLLADEGYGITQLVALLLCVECSISYEGGAVCEPLYICVEEPENHLHPKFQSMLAEMFVEAFQKYNIHFIIETHSEYLIRKLQVMVADKENKLSPNDVSINYVDKDAKGISTNRKIEILEDGRLSEPFGPGFYDEADTLAMELMKYKSRRK